MAISLTVNGKDYQVDVPPDMPLLWVLRDVIGLTGTKFGCGISMCGACTVYLNGQPVRSCITLVDDIAGAEVTTIEGLAGKPAKAIQAAWREFDVPQCGYCQSGQIMSASALLEVKPRPTDADIDESMRGNVCRCATYHRIRAGIHRAADIMEG